MSEKRIETIKKRMISLLRNVRKGHRYSQTELAKHMKLDQSALSRIESGKQELSIEVWIRFCLMFGVDPESPMDESLYARETDKQLNQSMQARRRAI